MSTVAIGVVFAENLAFYCVHKEMNNLEATWKSDASTEIRANMNNLKPRFEDYKNAVESCAKRLEEIAEKYDIQERNLSIWKILVHRGCA